MIDVANEVFAAATPLSFVMIGGNIYVLGHKWHQY